jgi:hypothetical protein
MAEPLSATIPVVRSEPRTRRALWLEAIALRHQIAVLERSRTGEPLYVQDAVKGTRHYRYYVSRGLVRGSVQDDRRGWRVSAPELERAVRAATQQILSDRTAIAGAIEELDIDANDCLPSSRSPKLWIQSLRELDWMNGGASGSHVR